MTPPARPPGPARPPEEDDRAFDDALALVNGPAPAGQAAESGGTPSAAPGPASRGPGAAPDAPGGGREVTDRAGARGLGSREAGASQTRGPDGARTAAPHRAADTGNGTGNGTGPGGAPRTEEGKPVVGTHREGAVGWAEARDRARRAGRSAPGRTERVALERAFGRVLAEPLTALTDLPSFDTSAMDGWAVAGPGPWRIDAGTGVLAGQSEPEALEDGRAVRIATGARIPSGATAVIRSEHGRTTDGDGGGQLRTPHEVSPGQDIRPRGQECRSGDELIPSGSLVTPAVLGLAAAAGYDELVTLARPRVEVLVLGDELLAEGLPHDGLIRDALGPMLGPWLTGLGAEVLSTRRLGDDAEALFKAVTTSPAELIVTTGGTAAGPVDHVHPILRRAGAELLVDSVAVRPGHPMLLARLGGHRHLVGLPGNPLAAVSGLLTLAEPLLRPYRAEPRTVPVRDAVQGHPRDTRLVPVVHHGQEAQVLRYNGPAMLRGVAAADGLAVVPPGGAAPGRELEILDLPWRTAR
ncbi:molybdopterin molybdotransferase MoeA [Streptomyces sp. GC420]|uniref:molybdopterin molybdotransferase MoeA n=1 Tax=Streptomyces sp. GC420 TaxID=2697568 RepID=UPI0014151025|nr:molybdopterin molybdotransferase MoeA [Streptomyces sp. GC420]NBM15903.1 molybdopterin molybdenumtransferase MoeA [Streptomyces sp. GC420]